MANFSLNDFTGLNGVPNRAPQEIDLPVSGNKICYHSINKKIRSWLDAAQDGWHDGQNCTSDMPIQSITAYYGSMAVIESENDGQSELAEQTELAYTNFSGDGRTVVTEGSAESYFYIKDHLDSTRQVLDENAQLVEMTSYKWYGSQVPEYEGSADNAREKFTGKELDTEGADAENGIGGIQLSYFGFRYLDHDIGRWISPDPAEQYWSGFQYSNSPINTIDPNGLRDSPNPNLIKHQRARQQEFRAKVAVGARLANEYGPSVLTWTGNAITVVSIACGACSPLATVGLGLSFAGGAWAATQAMAEGDYGKAALAGVSVAFTIKFTVLINLARKTGGATALTLLDVYQSSLMESASYVIPGQKEGLDFSANLQLEFGKIPLTTGE